MTMFPNDALDPAAVPRRPQPAVLSANSTDTALHALRDIARATRGGMQLRWKINGFSSPPRPSGTPRNLMGFKDGIANPDRLRCGQLIWTTGEPAWAAGG